MVPQTLDEYCMSCDTQHSDPELPSDKGLKEFWETGKSKTIPPDLQKRVENRLEVLDAAVTLNDLTGFHTHPLKATKPLRYSMAVNGPWRMTFEFRDGDAYRVDLEQYH